MASNSSVVAVSVAASFMVALLASVGAVVGTLFAPRGPRRSPLPPPPDRRQAAPVTAQTLRLRVVNMFMLPTKPVTKAVRRAAKSSLFDGADVILMQEMFRRAFAGTDPVKYLLCTLTREGYAATGAVAETPCPAGKFTDGGLAAIGLGPWHVKYLAFAPFSIGTSVDALATKGVAVFSTCFGIRLATTHLQASYHGNKPTKAGAEREEMIRSLQFAEAVDFALHHGVHVLAGDFNTSEPATVAAMERLVSERTAGWGFLVKPGNGNTTAKRDSEQRWRDTAPDDTTHGHTIDYVFILDPTPFCGGGGEGGTCRRLRVFADRTATTKWSDHAVLEVILPLDSRWIQSHLEAVCPA